MESVPRKASVHLKTDPINIYIYTHVYKYIINWSTKTNQALQYPRNIAFHDEYVWGEGGPFVFRIVAASSPTRPITVPSRSFQPSPYFIHIKDLLFRKHHCYATMSRWHEPLITWVEQLGIVILFQSWNNRIKAGKNFISRLYTHLYTFTKSEGILL